jgi:hypothetical protein
MAAKAIEVFKAWCCMPFSGVLGVFKQRLDSQIKAQ